MHDDVQALTRLKCKCGDRLYHEACLNTYKKRSGGDASRMSGFPCPRGMPPCNVQFVIRRKRHGWP